MKQLLVLFACLGISVSAFAQFNAILYSLTPLTQACGSGAPLGPECNGVIYWDQNSNGPDPSDLPVPAGNLFGQANFNTFPINGAEMLGVPGGFLTDPAFTIVTNTPEPSRYYIVVECGTVRWTSAVFTVANGLNEYDLSEGWSCVGQHCDLPTYYFISSELFGYWLIYSECLEVCAEETITLCFGPLPPTIYVMPWIIPGCNYGAEGSCDVECPSVQYLFDPQNMVYDSVNSTWCTSFLPMQTGCVCLNVEGTPVEQAAFDAVARDGAALISWATASESDIDYFQLKRDNVVVHTAAATNSSTGSRYTYLDENLSNGRTYIYSLETVNLNGTVEVWSHTASATPSLNSAVVTEYALHQNYPNPFNPSTNISYDVVETGPVTLVVYNIAGQVVGKLVDGIQSAGRHTVSFDASNLTSGLYFYTVEIGNEFAATKKMLLVK